MAKVKHGIMRFIEKGDIHPSVRGRKELKKQLEETRTVLLNNIPDMTPQKEILLNETMRCMGVLWLASLYMNRVGIFLEGPLKRKVMEPQPFLKTMLAFSNTLRLNLISLGLDSKKADEALNPLAYVKQEYGGGKDEPKQ